MNPSCFDPEYVEELSLKYEMSLTLANTAQRGYHLQQQLGQPRKKGETSYKPPPLPQLAPIFVCVSFRPIICPNKGAVIFQ